MLSYLQINNIALIDELTVEFGPGLNLLTGETGSGKSIIVDSLGALTGDRVSSDLIKEGYDTARIEGLFALPLEKDLHSVLESGGIDIDPADTIELIVRRELTLSGRNRIFINNQLATAALLKRIGPFLVDIHGQGDQSSLFDPTSHLELLDTFAGSNEEISTTSKAFEEWRAVRDELADLKRDEAAKLQLVDVLRFQVDELSQAALQIGESEELGSEKRRLNNIEKLSALSSEAFSLLYEMDGSATSTLDQGLDRLRQLAEYDERFREYIEPLESAAAVISDAAFALRDFRSGLEFSPSRLEEIEERLAEISRLERKYGGSTVTALEHLAASEKRLANIETSELREKELTALLAAKHKEYIASATLLSEKRKAAAKQFELAVKNGMNQVALEKARFEIRFDSRPAEDYFTETGFDRIEFFFSANPGESPKPLVKVASGGEASRLMLVLKTAGDQKLGNRTAVFDEIDAGIGGRVAEAVGIKLKSLAETQQVLCVTHQAQIASKADRHFVVEKSISKNKTKVGIRELSAPERIEEVARMLAGEKITDAARENAREMIAGASRN